MGNQNFVQEQTWLAPSFKIKPEHKITLIVEHNIVVSKERLTQCQHTMLSVQQRYRISLQRHAAGQSLLPVSVLMTEPAAGTTASTRGTQCDPAQWPDSSAESSRQAVLQANFKTKSVKLKLWQTSRWRRYKAIKKLILWSQLHVCNGSWCRPRQRQ